MTTPISLTVITRNAEAHIERCLRSVPFIEDLVVLDCGSTDRTVALAEACGARVFVEAWRGFGPQKRRAAELAKHEWILSLDADEALSPESLNEVEDWARRGLVGEAYAFPRLSYHMGRWIHHGGWYPDWQVRLFDRRKTNWTDAQIHEKVAAVAPVRLRFPLHHWVFADLSDQVSTNNRYSSLGAEDLYQRGRAFTLFNLLVKPKVKFIETYIWKRGFLDGLPGFIIAVGAAYSVFLKWAKLWEKQKPSS